MVVAFQKSSKPNPQRVVDAMRGILRTSGGGRRGITICRFVAPWLVPPRGRPNTGAVKSAAEEFQFRLQSAVNDGSFVRLTLGSPRGTDATLRQLIVRPVNLKAGPRLALVWRHVTRDLTKNLTLGEALELLEPLIGLQFASAHLFTTEATVQLELRERRPPRLHVGPATAGSAVRDESHDRTKQRPIAAENAWLRALGVTTAAGKVCAGMEAKFRQVNRFVELLAPLLAEASLPADVTPTLVDMGCGKGSLTFAAHACLSRVTGRPVRVRGVEARLELVALGNRVAAETAAEGLVFNVGQIADIALERTDVLVALHACDTATDDALAWGVAAGAALLIVAPCCHQEIRPQMIPPAVLAEPLRHGIFRERQAEFVTDALRAALLEQAGYSTRVFEFIAPEHTGKNLMIAAVKRAGPFDREAAAGRVRDLAAFYSVHQQTLATRLGFDLGASSSA